MSIKREITGRSSPEEITPLRPVPKLGLQKDLRDFVALCLSKKVEFIVVGGWAIGKELLIKNKMISGRPQDLVDATKLKTAVGLE